MCSEMWRTVLFQIKKKGKRRCRLELRAAVGQMDYTKVSLSSYLNLLICITLQIVMQMAGESNV